MDKQKNRTVYFDYLRVFATFAVVILHMSSQYWNQTDVSGTEWHVLNFFDGMVRWAVPVFVMISGALFLNRDISVKKIYGKYVLRLVIAFAAWSVIYALFSDGDIARRLLILIKGRYHMWFIPMMIGLYISIPLIKPIAGNENLLKYYLFLAFAFAFAIPQVITLAGDFAEGPVVTGMAAFGTDISNMYFYIVSGYAGYFILGYYLSRLDLNRKQQRGLCLLGGLGFVLTIGLEAASAFKMKESCGNYFNDFTVNVLLESIGVFIWFKYRTYRLPRLYPYVLKLSKYSFGAYLVHALILEKLDSCFGINALSFHPAAAVLSIGIFVSAVSFLISGLLNQIPIVKKYMV